MVPNVRRYTQLPISGRFRVELAELNQKNDLSNLTTRQLRMTGC